MGYEAIIEWVLRAITGVSKAVEVTAKPPEVKIGEFNEQKELREQDFSQKMIEDDFDYLKSRPEITIPNYLKQVHPDMKNFDGYVQLITERVVAFRQDVVKRRGFRWRRHREWLEKRK